MPLENSTDKPALAADTSTETPFAPISAIDALPDGDEGGMAFINAEEGRLRASTNIPEFAQRGASGASGSSGATSGASGPPGVSGPSVTPPPGLGPTGPTGASAPGHSGPGVSGASTLPPSKPQGGPSGPPPADDIEIDGKKYTREQLATILKAQEAPQLKPEPKAPPAPPSPEEIERQKKEIAEREAAFVKELSAAITDRVAIKPEELETILAGGEDALKALGDYNARIVAQSVLLARKGIFEQLSPHIQRLNNVVSQQEQLDRVATEQAFLTTYPEYAEHIELTRNVAEELARQYPNEVARMSGKQFMAEVDRQTNAILQQQYKAWNPTATNTWKDAVKARKAPAQTPVTPPPAASGPAAAASGAPGVSGAPPIKPPTANSPSAVAPSGALPDFHKNVAATLLD